MNYAPQFFPVWEAGPHNCIIIATISLGCKASLLASSDLDIFHSQRKDDWMPLWGSGAPITRTISSIRCASSLATIAQAIGTVHFRPCGQSLIQIPAVGFSFSFLEGRVTDDAWVQSTELKATAFVCRGRTERGKDREGKRESMHLFLRLTSENAFA